MAVRGIADSAKWEVSHRYLQGQIPRATHRTVITHQFLPNLKGGLEWNARADELGIVANWRALTETARRPAVIFGTSSDRIGTPDGQAWFVTVSKSLHHQTGLPIAPYVSVSYSGYDDRILYPFGLNAALGEHWSAMLINDGVHTHLSATYAWSRFAITVLAVRREDFGLSLGARF
jgi:hypothetical protein